jgi:hypothetical protein
MEFCKKTAAASPLCENCASSSSLVEGGVTVDGETGTLVEVPRLGADGIISCRWFFIAGGMTRPVAQWPQKTTE